MQTMPGDLTGALHHWSAGRRKELEPFLPEIMRELTVLARHNLKDGRRTPTLDTGSLLSDAYLRLLKASSVSWESRRSFYGYMDKLMENAITDRQRRKAALCRNSGTPDLPLEAVPATLKCSEIDAATKLSIKAPFERLHALDPQQAMVAHLKIFEQMTWLEIAERFGFSVSRAKRVWLKAKLFLAREIKHQA